MAEVEGVRAKRFPTDAERTGMLKSVEKLVLMKCGKFLRKAVRRTNGQGRDESVFEDAAQSCRLMLWKVAGDFDLDGKAKWATFAFNAITHALARCNDDFHQSTLRGRAFHFNELEDWSTVSGGEYASDDEDGPDEFDADDFDAVERSLDVVHRAMNAPAMDALTASQRRLFEMVVFRRLTLAQVAEQLGQKFNIVEKNFRGAVARLHGAGVVTDEMAAAHGVTVRVPKPCRVWQPGERGRFLEAVRAGRPTAEIAEEFNVSVARVTGSRRNIASLLARDARAGAAYVTRENFQKWPADEQERLLAALDTDRTNEDIAAEFRIDRGRVVAYRRKRPKPLPALASLPASAKAEKHPPHLPTKLKADSTLVDRHVAETAPRQLPNVVALKNTHVDLSSPTRHTASYLYDVHDRILTALIRGRTNAEIVAELGVKESAVQKIRAAYRYVPDAPAPCPA